MNAAIESLRLPPHSVEAEQAVLGSLLLSNTAYDRISDVVVEGDFYRSNHRAIWSAIVKLIDEARQADVLTVMEALKSLDKLSDVGGMSYLHQLATSTPSAVNVRRYAELVRDRSIERRLAEAGTCIADAAYNTRGQDAAKLLDEAERRILEVGEMRARKAGDFRRMSPLLSDVMSRLDELYKNPATVTGKATGFVDLDEMTSGLQDGDLVIVAGRPSMGKTAFALNIAESVALELKLPVLVFSMEMSGTQLVTRMLGSVAHVDAHRLRTGRVDQGDWDRLGMALGKLNDAPIEIDETGALNPVEMRARARRKAREYGGLGLIVVDYIQLMQGSGEARQENRATEIGDITGSLKAMAKEFHCPVVALSQLNRSLENRANKRPVMSDLRDSGSIEQDADVILFIYRDEVYNEDSPDKGMAELIIGKQRNGPIGTVRLTFIARHTRFENFSGMYQPRTPSRPPSKAFNDRD